MARLSLRTAANATAIAACACLVTLAGFAAGQFGRRESAVSTAPGPSPRPPYAGGSRIASFPTSAIGEQRTAILVLSVDCRFCEASLAFYRRLSVLPGMDGRRGRLVVLSVGNPLEMERYLAESRVIVHSVLALGHSGVTAVRIVPDVIVLDGNGVVLGSWAGRLTPELETAVLKLLVFAGP